jgi:hypothetical protein
MRDIARRSLIGPTASWLVTRGVGGVGLRSIGAGAWEWEWVGEERDFSSRVLTAAMQKCTAARVASTSQGMSLIRGDPGPC